MKTFFFSKWLAFVNAEYRYQFGSGLAVWGYAFGIFLNLLIYYYTSKAFVPVASLGNSYLSKGYFEFIILGELALVIPQISIGEGQEAFFRLKESGVLEQLYFSRLGLFGSLIRVYYSLVFFKMLFVMSSLVLGLIFFHLSLSFNSLIFFLGIQLLSSFLFLGLYFFNLSLSFMIGRRNGSIQHLVNILCFFSGAYFPLEIFSSKVVRTFLSHSPFALQVELTRNLLYGHSIDSYLNLLFYLSWCLIPWIVSFLLLRFTLKNKTGTRLC